MRALRMQRELAPLNKMLFCQVNPIPVKAAMEMLGFRCGAPRLPLTSLESQYMAGLQQAIQELYV